MAKLHGIYRIHHLDTGKSYIGSAVNITQRLNSHLTHLNSGIHPNIHLQRAWDKYGPHNFGFTVLEFVDSPTDLIPREQHWIDHHDAFKTGYNRRPIAQSNLGYKASADTKRKMSEAQTGRKVVISEEQRRKISKTLTGRKPSDETRAKLSAAHKGRKITWGHKISEANRRAWATEERREQQKKQRALPKDVIFSILDDHKNGDSKHSLSEKYGITRRMISYIVNGQYYCDYYIEWTGG